jgi:hypothetical protein
MKKKYHILGNSLWVDEHYSFKYNVAGDSILLLNRNGCELRFKRDVPEKTLKGLGIKQISYYDYDPDDYLVDSLLVTNEFAKGPIETICPVTENAPNARIAKKNWMAHNYIRQLFRLADSIRVEDLDKEFDMNMHDTRKTVIILKTYDGKNHKIVTCGNHRTPFEVKILASYLKSNRQKIIW